MKKFIGIVSIVAIISLIGTIISFVVLDLPKLATAIHNWDNGFNFHWNIGWDEDEIENLTDDITDHIYDWADDLSESIEEKVEDLTEFDDSNAKDIVQDITEKIIPKTIITDKTYTKGLEEIASEDGYIDENYISKYRSNKIVEQWTQDINDISKINVKTDNISIVMAKTKKKEAEFILTTYPKNNKTIDRNEQWIGNGYYINVKNNHKNIRSHHLQYTLFVLVPDDYNGLQKIEVDNGSVIAVKQSKNVDIEIDNGNIIYDQAENCNLKLKIDNGNIIADFTPDLDANINVEVDHGSIIGDNNIKVNSEYNHIYGDGNYQIEMEVDNGNIIWNKE